MLLAKIASSGSDGEPGGGSRSSTTYTAAMVFADLKNDFVFRRIFATHPDLLCALLNDLLERTGDRTIEAIEYLPSEHLPLAAGAKPADADVFA
jgi:hypothetical protein